MEMGRAALGVGTGIHSQGDWRIWRDQARDAVTLAAT